MALLSQRLDHVTVCLKHRHDVISDGRCVVVVPEAGSPRRCGGQGDVLAGSAGTFFHWTNAFDSEKNGVYGAACGAAGVESEDGMIAASSAMLAAFAACLLTKRCNAKSFALRGRSTTTVDLIDNIGAVFMESFET